MKEIKRCLILHKKISLGTHSLLRTQNFYFYGKISSLKLSYLYRIISKMNAISVFLTITIISILIMKHTNHDSLCVKCGYKLLA